MTKDEAKVLLRTMMAAYPNFRPVDLEDTVKLWSALLKDYDYKTFAEGLQAYILTDPSGFAPSIGQLITSMSQRAHNYPNALECWSLVKNAVSNSLYHAEEEFNKLPLPAQRAIGSAGALRNMAQQDIKSFDSVEQSHFIRVYDTTVKRMEDEAKLPEALRLTMKNKQLLLGGGESV